MVCFSSGCGKTKEEGYTGYYIYCLDTNETKVTAEKYTPKEKNNKKLIREMLKRMQKEPEDISLKKAIPDNVELDDYTLSGIGQPLMVIIQEFLKYCAVLQL